MLIVNLIHSESLSEVNDSNFLEIYNLIWEIVKYYPRESYPALELFTQMCSIDNFAEMLKKETNHVLGSLFSLLEQKEVSLDEEQCDFVFQVIAQFLRVADRELTFDFVERYQKKWIDSSIYVKKATIIANELSFDLSDNMTLNHIERYVLYLDSEDGTLFVKNYIFHYLENLVMSKRKVSEKLNEVVTGIWKKYSVEECLFASASLSLLSRLLNFPLWNVDAKDIAKYLCQRYVDVKSIPNEYFDSVTRSLQVLLVKTGTSEIFVDLCDQVVSAVATKFSSGFPKGSQTQIMLLLSISGPSTREHPELMQLTHHFLECLIGTSHDMFFDAVLRIIGNFTEEEQTSAYTKLFPVLLEAFEKKRAVPLGLFKHYMKSKAASTVVNKYFDEIMDTLISLLSSKVYSHRSILLETIVELGIDHTMISSYENQITSGVDIMIEKLENQEVGTDQIDEYTISILKYLKMIVSINKEKCIPETKQQIAKILEISTSTNNIATLQHGLDIISFIPSNLQPDQRLMNGFQDTCAKNGLNQDK